MATWDNQKKQWKASVGSGGNRRYLFAPRTPGEVGLKGEPGETAAELLKVEFLYGPAPCRPGSLNEFVDTVWFPYINDLLDEGEMSFETVRVYGGTYRNHIEPMVGNMLLTEFNPSNCQQFQIHVKQKFESKKTAKNVFGVFNAILSEAERLERIIVNPCRKLRPIQAPRRYEVYDLSLETIAALDELFKDSIYEGPVWAQTRLALRGGEVLGLRPSDVTVLEDRAIIHLSQSRQRYEVRDRLKNRQQGERPWFAVPLSFGQKLLSYQYSVKSDEPLFRNQLGEPINPATFYDTFSHKVKRAGLSITNKQLRNLAITTMINNGVPEFVVQDIARHRHIQTTQIYFGKDSDVFLSAFRRAWSTDDHS